jgi:7-cyano-7-deazaguanine synthase
MDCKAIVIFSGGLDSTTLLYHLRAEGYDLRALSVNYGQRHQEQELAAAHAIAGQLGIDRQTLDLTALTELLGKNSLSDLSVGVPEGPYAEESMRLTTVPNRNMILLSVAIAWAASLKVPAVAFAAHGGAYTPYPDCQPAFAEAMDQAARVCHWSPIRVLAPFVHWTKADIVRRGAELGVPFALTWSCYQGGARHCGRCGTCLDRKAAFATSGVPDPTQYETAQRPGS